MNPSVSGRAELARILGPGFSTGADAADRASALAADWAERYYAMRTGRSVREVELFFGLMADELLPWMPSRQMWNELCQLAARIGNGEMDL